MADGKKNQFMNLLSLKLYKRLKHTIHTLTVKHLGKSSQNINNNAVVISCGYFIEEISPG